MNLRFHAPLPTIAYSTSTMYVLALALLLACMPAATQAQAPGVRLARHAPPESLRGELAVAEPMLRPFYHGVASGDPSTTSVTLWTRLTPDGTSLDVTWKVATDSSLSNVVLQGQATADAAHDYCIKVRPEGLAAGTVYYYGFVHADRTSLTGRTRTLPEDNVDHLRFGVVSCSNYPAGYFNAYASLAMRNDLDAIVHLGDYIYEYSADTTSYAGATGKQLNRSHEPANEIVTESDYRARYNQYHLDPDLIRLHQQHPFIYVYDDHESANNAYNDGAQNHNAGEGSWATRKEISRRVCFDWMPLHEQASGAIWREFAFGNLMTLFMLDTRLDGRDKQVTDLGDDAKQVSKDSLNDPSRKIMSAAQYAWLADGLAGSASRWNVLGNQVMFSHIVVTPIDTAYLFSAIPPANAAFLRGQMPLLADIFESAFYGDVWSNYPAQRARLAEHIRASGIDNLVVITGDFHAAFAMNIARTWNAADTASIGVEFMTPSISSPNFDETFASNLLSRTIAPQLIETIYRTTRAANTHLNYTDIVHHGYVVLDVTPDRVQGDFFFADTLYERNPECRFVRAFSVAHGQKHLREESAASAGKSEQDTPSPLFPPHVTSVDDHASGGSATGSTCVIMSLSPNPSAAVFTLTFSMQREAYTSIDIVDAQGRASATLASGRMLHGIHTLAADASVLANGRYAVRITSGGDVQTIPLLVQR